MTIFNSKNIQNLFKNIWKIWPVIGIVAAGYALERDHITAEKNNEWKNIGCITDTIKINIESIRAINNEIADNDAQIAALPYFKSKEDHEKYELLESANANLRDKWSQLDKKIETDFKLREKAFSAWKAKPRSVYEKYLSNTDSNTKQNLGSHSSLDSELGDSHSDYVWETQKKLVKGVNPESGSSLTQAQGSASQSADGLGDVEPNENLCGFEAIIDLLLNLF